MLAVAPNEDRAAMQHAVKVDRYAFKAAGGSDADFDQYDADHNGSLDEEELQVMAAAKANAPTCTVPLGQLLMHTPVDSPQSIAEVVVAARVEHEKAVEQRDIQEYAAMQLEHREVIQFRRLQQRAAADDRPLIAESIRQRHLEAQAEAKRAVRQEREAQSAASRPTCDEGSPSMSGATVGQAVRETEEGAMLEKQAILEKEQIAAVDANSYLRSIF